MTIKETWYSKHKEISKKRASLWRKAHPEMHRERVKKWKRENPKKIWQYRIKEKYGISVDQYNELFLKQAGKCAICKMHQDYLDKPLFVDHNHETKRIRGLLCTKCNSALGFINEDEMLLFSMAQYLNEHN